MMTGVHVFAIEGEAHAQLPNRVIGLFAQRDLLPDQIDMRTEAECLYARIVISDLDQDHAAIIAAKIRSFVTVRAVRLE